MRPRADLDRFIVEVEEGQSVGHTKLWDGGRIVRVWTRFCLDPGLPVVSPTGLLCGAACARPNAFDVTFVTPPPPHTLTRSLCLQCAVLNCNAHDMKPIR